jgi:HSP20 family protein
MALVRFTRHQPRINFPAFAGTPTFEDMESRVRNLIEGVGTSRFNGDLGAETIRWNPATEIAETPTELSLTAELPGMETKDVDISVEDGVLTIRGEKTQERTEGKDEKQFYLWERSYGAFERSFTLPRTVDASKISAVFDKGVLKVKMPKSEEAKAKGRKIEISAK